MKKFICLFILSLFLLNSGYAQTDSLESIQKRPVLYGHTFPSMSQFSTSFINTSLNADIGIGGTSVVRVPGISIGDHEIGSFEGQLLFLSMRIQYQQKFTPWLALYFSFNLAGRLGTSMSTILVDGVNTMSGGDIGWLIRIKQTKRFNLSGRVNVKNLSGQFINVTQFVEDIINDVPAPSIIKKVPAMAVGLGINGAYAISQGFGLQFEAGYAYGESFVREKTEGYFAAGVLLDYDFNPNQQVPLGFAMGYTMTSAPEVVMDGGKYSNLFTGKIGYTGASDFELGLQFSFFNVKLDSVDDSPLITKALLVLRFYF